MPWVPEKFLLFTLVVLNHLVIALGPTPFGGNSPYIGSEPSTTKLVLLEQINPWNYFSSKENDLIGFKLAHLGVVPTGLDP